MSAIRCIYVHLADFTHERLHTDSVRRVTVSMIILGNIYEFTSQKCRTVGTKVTVQTIIIIIIIIRNLYSAIMPLGGYSGAGGTGR